MNGLNKESQFHQICTQVDSLQASKSNDPTNLIFTLLGYKSVPETAAMKHGKGMEPHAKSSYLSIVKRKHRKFKSNEAGLVIMNDKQFIGISLTLRLTVHAMEVDLLKLNARIPLGTLPQVQTSPLFTFGEWETQT